MTVKTNTIMVPSSLSKTTFLSLLLVVLLSTKTKTINAFDIKKVGGGIPLTNPGNLDVFNPEIEGKLQGTGDLQQRLELGASYKFIQKNFEEGQVPSYGINGVDAPPQNVPSDVTTLDCQHWLEDIGLPTNYAKPTKPAIAEVLGRAKLIKDDAPGDIQHIILKLPEGMNYVEGQSLSVIPPGIDIKTNKNYSPRLYSIASTRFGDLLDGNTVSLCVRRAEYYDPITGIKDDSKKGICSNYLCDIKPGTKVQVAGPVGKTMLLPEDDPTTDIIMVATGTGIAPFRAFLHRLFMENTLIRQQYVGNAWLILGVPTTSGLLYYDEIEQMKKNSYPINNLCVDYAISREMNNNVDGGKMYVQHILMDKADELFDKLDSGAQIYFCGLKGMMPSILETLEQVATSRGIDWSTKLTELKKNHQWHVEVY